MKRLFLLAAFALPVHAGQVLHHDADGRPVLVIVKESEPCPYGKPTACAHWTIYLNGLPASQNHELAHVAGMKHTAWVRNGLGVACATVTEAGFDTGYRTGDLICSGFNGQDVIEKRASK